MPPSKLPEIASFRKQHLLLEYARLQHRAPPGIYFTLSPDDPSLWSGIIFVRTGPYARSILRCTLSFPTQYPQLPPFVTFATEIFHPLIVPLTTYTFSTGTGDPNDTVSAGDEERLPPGGFSLRHGFPAWFGRERRGRRMRESGGSEDSMGSEGIAVATAAAAVEGPAGEKGEPPDIVRVLQYVKASFEDVDVLDKLPLEVAGSAGAWHAWRSYRGLASKGGSGAAAGSTGLDGVETASRPSEWSWEGVWESRVRIGIEHSQAEATLFGPKGGRGERRTELIRFSKMTEDQINDIRKEVAALEIES